MQRQCNRVASGVSRMSITQEQVEKVALLARLRLSPDELETMTAQLGQILDYMELLSEVATDDV